MHRRAVLLGVLAASCASPEPAYYTLAPVPGGAPPGASGAATPVKTRLRAAGQALVRMDEGTATPPVPVGTPEMIAAIMSADVLVVADYGRGVAAAPEIRAAILEAVGQRLRELDGASAI